jgi:WhiB family redox-sensing transcriptional regulator
MHLVGQRWKLQGACSVQTPDVPEMWTPERRPRRPVMVLLQQICDGCPVRRQCAAEAVASSAETWVAAGVFIPEQKRARGWAAAMEELEEIAGADYLGGAAGLGATA